MTMPPQLSPDEMATLSSRTLRAAGYDIIDFQRTRDIVEIRCKVPSRFGAVLKFQFVITNRDSLTAEEEADFRRAAETQGLPLVLVGMHSAEGQMGWEEFTRVLGGAVPSWRALQPTYKEALLAAAHNRLPEGEKGEPWFIFEELAGDGLEFVLGRRVLRRGGHRRGLRVSDMIAQLPDFALLVVDAKATRESFDAAFPQLRPLVEYTTDTQRAQAGNPVIGAVVVSSAFRQDHAALQEINAEFLSYTRVPVTFITAETLADLVDQLRANPRLRNAVRWPRLFVGGLLTSATGTRVLETAAMLRVEPQEG